MIEILEEFVRFVTISQRLADPSWMIIKVGFLTTKY